VGGFCRRETGARPYATDSSALYSLAAAPGPRRSPPQYELELVRKDGDRLSVLVSGSPRFEGGRFAGTLAVFTDITARKRAEEALREANRKIERLHQAAHRLEACETEDRVYRLTVEAAEHILEFAACQLCVVEEGQLATKAVSTGLPPELREAMSLDMGLTGEAYRTGQTRVFDDLDRVPQAGPLRETFRSTIVAPIADLGVFRVVSAAPHAFAEQDARLLELLLGHTAEALKRIRLQDKLREQSIRDALTGVYNRRYFSQMIEQELQRSETGDEANAVARRIRGAVARWGEENHLVDFPITLAVGARDWRPEAGESLAAVLHEADRRMYEDKRRQAAGMGPGGPALR